MLIRREQPVGHDGPPNIDIDWHVGRRDELRPLFELAEDSRTQLDDYLDQGRVLVAVRGSAMVGHLQLVPTTRSGEIELKNMAVVPDQRGTGVGRALVVAALRGAVRRVGRGWWSPLPRRIPGTCVSINVWASGSCRSSGMRSPRRPGIPMPSSSTVSRCWTGCGCPRTCTTPAGSPASPA